MTLFARQAAKQQKVHGASHLRHLRWLVLCLMLGGCHVPAAPADVSDLTRWFWLYYSAADDASLREAVRHLDTSVGANLKDAQESTIVKLSPGDAKKAGDSYEPDLTKATGLLLMDLIHCPLSRVEEMVIQKDQKSLHSNYITYDRHYTSSIDDYQARTTPLLGWVSDYELSLLGPNYTSELPGGTRYLKATSTGAAPTGPVLLARAFFDKAATFSGGASDYYKQDLQIQVFYERSPGVVVHLYGSWIEMEVAGFDNNSPELQTIYLNSLQNSDKDYEAHCNE